MMKPKDIAPVGSTAGLGVCVQQSEESEITEEQYTKAIPACCAYQTLEAHKDMLLCWGLVSSIERSLPMNCGICELNTMKTPNDLGNRRAAFGASELTDVLCGNGTEVGAGDTAHECSTCGGVGTIDLRLGGEWNSDPKAKCPDCDGTGETAKG